MKLPTFIKDDYDREARFYPALMVGLPVAVSIALLLSASFSTVQAGAIAVLGWGGAFLLAQLARDHGKRREPGLWESWGGPPSVAIFRHRDTHLAAPTKARYHGVLGVRVANATAPTPDAEAADPVTADGIYRSWSDFLREQTRDPKKYPLVFKENVNYGFRRNTWGLRPLGIGLNLSLVVVASGRIAWVYLHAHSMSGEAVGALVVSLITLLLWLIQFTPRWVQIPAEAYALRLAEATTTLEGKGGRGGKSK